MNFRVTGRSDCRGEGSNLRHAIGPTNPKRVWKMGHLSLIQTGENPEANIAIGFDVLLEMTEDAFKILSRSLVICPNE
jgi:hypothetical protein